MTKIKNFIYCLLILLVTISCTDNTPIKAQIDHITLYVSDLEKGIQEFEASTGIKPHYGGKHKGGITHNALVGLGDGMYLEIKAPQNNEKAKKTTGEYNKYTSPTPVKWMVRSNNIKKAAKSLKKMKIKTSGIYSGERLNQEGNLLKWKTFHLSNKTLASKPAFIQWQNIAHHPSQTLKNECQLTDFIITTPLFQELESLAMTFNLKLTVKQAQKESITVKIKCPKGETVFASN